MTDHDELRRLAEVVDMNDDWWHPNLTGNHIDTKNPDDIAYIAAVDPATVLGLLDEIAALRFELQMQQTNAARNNGYLIARAEAAEAAVAAVERVRALHRRRAWGEGLTFDFATHGQTEFPAQCDHCHRAWPCDTADALQNASGSPVSASEVEVAPEVQSDAAEPSEGQLR